MQFFLNGRHQATLSDFDTEPLVRSIIISLFSGSGLGKMMCCRGKAGWGGGQIHITMMSRQ